MRFARQKPGAGIAVGLSAAVLALGLASCGGDEDSTSSASSSTNSTTAPGPPATSGSSSGSNANSGSGADPGSNGDSGQKTTARSAKGVDENTTPQEEREEASKFVPKHHTDAGGGSAQFLVKEGDNSIQEYGDEITGAEFEEASAVLHNYLDARAAANWAAACATYSEDMVKQVERLGELSRSEDSGCAGILGGFRNPEADAKIQAEAGSAEVFSLRAEDDQGFLIYRGFEGDVYVIPMKKDDGKWKVGALEGSSPF